MKIIENIEDNKVDFENILIGEVFRHNNDYFMRIEDAKTVRTRTDDNIRANAVDLSLGICSEFSKYCKVEKINAAMTVIG